MCVSKPGDYDQPASWFQSHRHLRRMDLSAVRLPKEKKKCTMRVIAPNPPKAATNAGDLHHLQPPHVEKKLQQGEDWQVKVHVVTRVSLRRIQELTADQTSQEEAVDCHRHHLVTAEPIN